jgi:hypothetical protein
MGSLQLPCRDSSCLQVVAKKVSSRYANHSSVGLQCDTRQGKITPTPSVLIVYEIPMLSHRAAKAASQLDIPWRFVPGAKDRYDPATNPNGIVSLATAENPLMHQELADFASKVSIDRILPPRS